MTDTMPAATGGHMTLMEHLIELRSRLIKCIVAIALGAVVGWFAYPHVVDILMEPLRDLAKNHSEVSDKFISFKPLEIFMLRVKISSYMGLVIAMPFVLWQVWKFVAPGLYQNERRYAGAFVASATALFVMGAAVAYFTLTPALTFLQSFGEGDVYFQYSAQEYLTLIVFMMVAFGAGFQFPIVVVALQLVGVVTPQQLAGARRMAIVIVCVVAAVITPSADPISMLALAVPMVVFYEISILIGRVVLRRRLRAASA